VSFCLCSTHGRSDSNWPGRGSGESEALAPGLFDAARVEGARRGNTGEIRYLRLESDRQRNGTDGRRSVDGPARRPEKRSPPPVTNASRAFGNDDRRRHRPKLRGRASGAGDQCLPKGSDRGESPVWATGPVPGGRVEEAGGRTRGRPLCPPGRGRGQSLGCPLLSPKPHPSPSAHPSCTGSDQP
jgi:hypothetical protein